MYIIPKIRAEEIIIYLRKSRSDDPLATVEEVLKNHEQMIDDWLEQILPKNSRVPEKNRYREVVSGETLDSRPKMQAVLRHAEEPQIKAIACKEPHRLSRGDLEDIGYLVKVLRYTGTLVLTPRGSYDLRDERDREQFERELMRSNDYLEYQKKIMHDGKLLALKKGFYLGTHPPYGYKKISYKEGRTTYRTLEPIPEEAAAVKRAFDLYKSGMGAIHICDVLDAEYPPPAVGKKWSTTSVYHMLNNVTYLGKLRWQYKKYVHAVEDGEIKRYRRESKDYYIFDGIHPAIIDQETWDAVHDIQGKIPKHKKGTELKNPLSGILYCECGRSMSHQQVTKRGKLIGAPRFLCSDPRCRNSGSALKSEIMDEVAKVLQNAIDDFEVQIKQGVDNSFELHMETIARLEKRLEDLRDLELRQWDQKTKGGMPDHVFEKLNAKTVTDIEEASQLLLKAKETAPVKVDIHARMVTFKKALELVKNPDTPAKETNDLVRACIERINYSRPKQVGYTGKSGNPEPFKLEFKLHI